MIFKLIFYSFIENVYHIVNILRLNDAVWTLKITEQPACSNKDFSANINFQNSCTGSLFY